MDEEHQKLTGYLVKGENTVNYKINENGTCPEIR